MSGDVRETFNPSRLTLAMMQRGKSPHGVAVALGIKATKVYAYQRGKVEPSAILVEHLAEVLDFPLAWFYGPTLEVPPTDGVSW